MTSNKNNWPKKKIQRFYKNAQSNDQTIKTNFPQITIKEKKIKISTLIDMCISTKNKISAHVSKELKLIRRLKDSDIVDVPPKKWFHRERWSRILGYFFRNPSFQEVDFSSIAYLLPRLLFIEIENALHFEFHKGYCDEFVH